MVRVYAIYSERRRLKIGSCEWFDVISNRLAAMQKAFIIHFEEYGGDFEQSVGFAIESAGFHVDNHR